MKGFIISIAAVLLLLATVMTGYSFNIRGPQANSLNVFNGNDIYAEDCAFCHGPMSSPTPADVMTANIWHIQKAFRLHTSMQNYVYSANTSVALGAVAKLKGKLSLAQMKAIIAAFGIYQGENLYNAKYPGNPSYNCSNCHGLYDNSQVSGASFRQIVMSFRQNKLHNNPMTPLKSKYKISELKLIANALAIAPPFSGSTSGSTGIDPVQGAILYYTDCLGCHNGPIKNLSQSFKSSCTPAQIQNAIDTNAGAGSTYGGMDTPQLTSLTSSQINDISAAIQNNTDPPTDWSGYSWPGCVTCHNGHPL